MSSNWKVTNNKLSATHMTGDQCLIQLKDSGLLNEKSKNRMKKF